MPQNPDWTKDELILGLDVYVSVGRSGLHPTHPRIIELSQYLNLIPLHPLHERDDKFRNPAGVNLTLRKFLAYDPNYAGIGLHPEGGLKQEVWREYAHRPNELGRVAQAIREAFKQLKGVSTPVEICHISFQEGGILFRLHQYRERSAILVKKKKEGVLRQQGCLACEVCRFDFRAFYGEIGNAFAECHHIKPLAQVTQRQQTKLTDLVIVCSNCHRMLHKAECALSVHDLKSAIDAAKRSATL